MPRGDLLLIMLVMGLALAIAEMSARSEESRALRWFVVALLWIVTCGMLMWLYDGA